MYFRGPSRMRRDSESRRNKTRNSSKFHNYFLSSRKSTKEAMVRHDAVTLNLGYQNDSRLNECPLRVIIDYLGSIKYFNFNFLEDRAVWVRESGSTLLQRDFGGSLPASEN